MNETDETFHEKPRNGSLAQNKVLTKYAPNSVFDFYSTTPNKEDRKIKKKHDKTKKLIIQILLKEN